MPSLVRFSPAMFTITVLLFPLMCLPLHRACYIQPMTNALNISGYQSLTLSFNVCVDNTTIRSREPTREPPIEGYVFVRECCGCRVSRATTREIELTTIKWPKLIHKFFFSEIHECLCIECNYTQNAHHRYLRELRH